MVGRLLNFLGLSLDVCPVCEERERGDLPLCRECAGKFRCEKPAVKRFVPGVKSFKAFGYYRDSLAVAVRKLKFGSFKPLAEFLGQVIEHDLKEFMSQTKADTLTYVPVHPLRKFTRGFDQNEEILKGTGISFKKLLIRKRYSKPLAGMKKSDRERNLLGAFAVEDPVYVRGRVILVFDDILTSGTTSSEVARTLLKSGAGEVHFYFLCIEY